MSAGKKVTFEVIRGGTLAMFDGGCGHRLAGPKSMGQPLLHSFEVDLDELIREAIAMRDAVDEDDEEG